jgi:hypothetical protein
MIDQLVGYSNSVYSKMSSGIKYRPWQISVVDFGLPSRYGGFFRDYLLLQLHKTADMADISGGFWPLCYGKYQPIWLVFLRLSDIAAPQYR